MRLKGIGGARTQNPAQAESETGMAEALSYAHGAAHVPETAAAPDAGRRAVAAWLAACAALVAIMVLVGGVTRLTHSGLSIVEWQPLVGTLPPLSEGDWQVVFEKYKQTPEYRLVNFGMSLAEFKGIFWWEYAHRLLGRLIGLAFFVPLAWFWFRGRLDRRLAWKLLGVFALGGLQGAMGWYMVKSGLVDDPRVSQFRLTAHLGLAFLIFGAMLWIALDLFHPRRNASPNAPSWLAGWVAALVFLQVLLGGLVAGIRAGKAYNTFPLMNGHVVPPETFMIDPVVEELLLQHGDRAARPSHGGLAAARAGRLAVGARVVARRRAPRTHGGQPARPRVRRPVRARRVDPARRGSGRARRGAPIRRDTGFRRGALLRSRAQEGIARAVAEKPLRRSRVLAMRAVSAAANRPFLT